MSLWFMHYEFFWPISYGQIMKTKSKKLRYQPACFIENKIQNNFESSVLERSPSMFYWNKIHMKSFAVSIWYTAAVTASAKLAHCGLKKFIYSGVSKWSRMSWYLIFQAWSPTFPLCNQSYFLFKIWKWN